MPFKLTLGGMFQFAVKPTWAINYFMHERFKLPQLDEHVDMSDGAMSIGRYFTEMLDPTMNWDDVAEMVHALEGSILSEGRNVGCRRQTRGRNRLHRHHLIQPRWATARWLASAFDQLAEIVDAVGDQIDVMMDGGVRRGTHVLKALSLGAKAVGIGRYYLFPLAAAGQAGVDRR